MARPPITAKGELLFRQQLNGALDYVEGLGGGGGLTTEQVDDRVAALLVEGSNITLTYDDGAGTLTIDAAGGAGTDSFETVNKNLDASNATLGYSGGNLVTVAYANGITKTLAYTGDNLTTVTLSGSTPGGIDLVKTLSYTGDDLTGVAYS